MMLRSPDPLSLYERVWLRQTTIAPPFSPTKQASGSMQSHYRSVCERQQQAVRRNQALLNDVRRVHSSTLASVDTTRLETLKSQYKSCVASVYPNWLAQVNSRKEGGKLPFAVAATLPRTHQSSNALSQSIQHQVSACSVLPPSPSPHYSVATCLSSGIMSTATQHSMAVLRQEDSMHLPLSQTASLPHKHNIVTDVPTTTQFLSHKTSASLPSEAVLSAIPGASLQQIVPTCTCTLLPHISLKSLQPLHSRQPDSLTPPAFSSPPVSPTVPCCADESNSLPVSQLTRVSECSSTSPPTSVLSEGMMLTGSTCLYQPDFKREGSVSLCTPVVTSSKVQEAIMSECSSSDEEKAPTLSSGTQASGPTLPSLAMSNSTPTTTSQQKPDAAITAKACTSLTISQTVCTTMHTSTQSTNEVCSSSAFLPSTSVTLSPPSISTGFLPTHQPLHDSSLANVSVAQPHNIIILSQEGSDSSLSLTPPLDVSDVNGGNKPQGSSGADGGSFGSGMEASPWRGSSQSEHAQVRTKDIQAADEQSSVDAQRNSEGSEEAIAGIGLEDAVTERTIEAEGVSNHVKHLDIREDDALDRSEKSSISDIPLPLHTPSHPLPPTVSDAFATNNVAIESNGSSNASEGEAKDVHTPSDNEGHSSEATAQSQPQNGKDAYASFLQSVCQSATTATPLLDSDSEGIEDMVAGREKGLQEIEPLGYPSRAGDSTATLMDGNIKYKDASKRRVADGDEKDMSSSTSSPSPSKTMKHTHEGEKEDGLPDVRNGSHSPHKPAYIPTAVEKEQNTQSKLLQKRLGFWESDSSMEGSEIEAPNADDDQGDFDFYM